jgi:hypothetical protein
MPRPNRPGPSSGHGVAPNLENSFNVGPEQLEAAEPKRQPVRPEQLEAAEPKRQPVRAAAS